MNLDLERIKDEHIANIRKREVWMIVRSDYGFQVQHWTPDGVAPQSEYDTPHEAVARMLQILGIQGPVSPQNWPEEVCVGFVEHEESSGSEWAGCTHLDCLPECVHSLENSHCERFARWQRENEK